MNNKQLVIIISVASFSITTLFLLFFSAYKYQPQWLGLPNPADTIPKKYDTVYIEPTVNITKNKLAHLEKEISTKNYLVKEKDSLKRERLFLLDSIKYYKSLVSKNVDSTKRVLSTLNQTKTKKDKLSDSLYKLNSQYKDAISQIELKKQTIENQEKLLTQKTDSLTLINFGQFAKLYNNANPQDVAKILEQLDEEDAAKILKLMSKKKAGKVIEALPAEKAATILLLGYSQ